MSHKPSYLGVLNAISNGESEAEGYLAAWAATTKSDDVRRVLVTVAIREGEHGKSFAKRITELGYELQPRTDTKAADRMAIACSTTLSDREKFEQLKLVRTGASAPSTEPPARDFFSTLFDDPTIDIATGTLLGRYIAEERDSGRLFSSCYEQLCCEEAATADAASDAASTTASLEARLASIEAILCSLSAALPESSARPTKHKKHAKKGKRSESDVVELRRGSADAQGAPLTASA